MAFRSRIMLKKLSLGIAGLSLVCGSFLCSQNKKIQEKENLETKTINYSLNDSAKTDTIKESDYILSKRKEFVDNAKKYIGTEWIWDGRATKNNPGIDCLGLIFLPYAKTFNKKWTEISVYPGEIIEKKQLGEPVKGLDGVLVKDIDYSKLKQGDIIHLLTQREPIDDRDIPSKIINKTKYRTWHTGIYSDEEKNLFLNASPGEEVKEQDLKEIVEYFPTEAIFATRIY